MIHVKEFLLRRMVTGAGSFFNVTVTVVSLMGCSKFKGCEHPTGMLHVLSEGLMIDMNLNNYMIRNCTTTDYILVM